MRFSWFGAIGVALAAGCSSGSFGSRGAEPIVPPPSPRPTFGATTTLAKGPPPISGGTLLVTAAERRAVAADPDRDRIVIANLDTGSTMSLALLENDEPGRAIESSPGRVHMVLRRGGAVVEIDLRTMAIVARTAVCPAPRGIAAAGDRIYVSCAGGELVAFSKTTGAIVLQKTLARDLRDIVVGDDGNLRISRFRSAEVLTVSLDGVVGATTKTPSLKTFGAKGDPREAEAEVAWRMIPTPSWGMLMIHQRARDPHGEPISIEPGGYSDDGSKAIVDATKPQPCGLGIVHAAFTLFDSRGNANVRPPLGDAVLPVDVAMQPGGSEITVVAAGNGHTPELGSILRYQPFAAESMPGNCIVPSARITPPGQPIAVVYVGDELVVQTREPARLVRYARDNSVISVIELPGDTREDTGHAIFHSNAGGFIACASCHPEGSDDGHVWSFADLGPRRTQNLRGGVSGTEPFHWNGELHDLTALMGEVFARRMSGEALPADRVTALSRWLDTIPRLANAPGDAEVLARGRALFEDAKVGCATCHTGPRFTNNTSVDVGTGGVFQVPSLLGVAHRAPFMHTGCAPTLADRFDVECGGDFRHGSVGHLTLTQRADLVAYLESL